MKFIEVVCDCYLHQHLEKPTRKRGNDEPSLIDLVLTDEVMQVPDIVYHAPLGKSDHNIISFNFNCYLDYSKPKELWKSWFRGNEIWHDWNKMEGRIHNCRKQQDRRGSMGFIEIEAFISKELHDIIKCYQEKVHVQPVNKFQIPHEHELNLKDETPVISKPRILPQAVRWVRFSC